MSVDDQDVSTRRSRLSWDRGIAIFGLVVGIVSLGATKYGIDRILETNLAIEETNEKLDAIEDALTPTTVAGNDEASSTGVISGLAADPNVRDMVQRRTHLFFDDDGNIATSFRSLMVPLIRHRPTGLCLWVDDPSEPAAMVSRDCADVYNAVVAAIPKDRSEYESSLYFGWVFEGTGWGTLSDRKLSRWRMCFSGDPDPSASYTAFFDSASCPLYDDDGLFTSEPIPLSPQESELRLTTALEPDDTSATQIWFWAPIYAEDNPAGCLALDSEQQVVILYGDSAGDKQCAEQLWEFTYPQWLVFREP